MGPRKLNKEVLNQWPYHGVSFIFIVFNNIFNNIKFFGDCKCFTVRENHWLLVKVTNKLYLMWLCTVHVTSYSILKLKRRSCFHTKQKSDWTFFLHEKSVIVLHILRNCLVEMCRDRLFIVCICFLYNLVTENKKKTHQVLIFIKIENII